MMAPAEFYSPPPPSPPHPPPIKFMRSDSGMRPINLDIVGTDGGMAMFGKKKNKRRKNLYLKVFDINNFIDGHT